VILEVFSNLNDSTIHVFAVFLKLSASGSPDSSWNWKPWPKRNVLSVL